MKTLIIILVIIFSVSIVFGEDQSLESKVAKEYSSILFVGTILSIGGMVFAVKSDHNYGKNFGYILLTFGGSIYIYSYFDYQNELERRRNNNNYQLNFYQKTF